MKQLLVLTLSFAFAVSAGSALKSSHPRQGLKIEPIPVIKPEATDCSLITDVLVLLDQLEKNATQELQNGAQFAMDIIGDNQDFKNYIEILQEFTEQEMVDSYLIWAALWQKHPYPCTEIPTTFHFWAKHMVAALHKYAGSLASLAFLSSREAYQAVTADMATRVEIVLQDIAAGDIIVSDCQSLWCEILP